MGSNADVSGTAKFVPGTNFLVPGTNFVAAGLVVGMLTATGPVSAQTDDYAAFRAQAIAALGGDADRIAYGGDGWDACLGQAWAVTDGWARWALGDYRRVIDYANGVSLQTAMRRAGLDPDRVGGCGGQVGAAAGPQQTSISGSASFAGKLPIWLTPHGVLRLADLGAPEIERRGDGWDLTVPVRSGPITHTVVASYGADYLPTRIRTRIDDPIFGDMEVAAEFGDYRDFGSLRFPGTLRLTQGGLATLELAIDSATSAVDTPEIPPARPFGGGGSPADAGPAYVAIGDGVFVMPGAYQGVAVEFEEFAVVIDGMQNDARTQEIIGLTHAAIPGKPIAYVVNTHSHFDHASGLRQYAAEGATILTHEINVPFFREALSAPRTLNPVPTEPARVDASVSGVSGRFVLTDDGGQRLEIVALEPSQHAADMLIAWLPAIRTVVEADLLQPWINPVFAGSGDGPHPYLVYLFDELRRTGLEVEQFVPVHTPPEPPTMPVSALEEAVGRTLR